jgi:hypothetical protein
VPVIRGESKPVSPGGVPGAYEPHLARSDDRVDAKRDSLPGPEPIKDIKAVANTLQEIKAAVAGQPQKTQAIVVRGLEALDRRDEQRQLASQVAVEAAVAEVAFRVDGLRQELRIIDRSARRQIDELSGHVSSTLNAMVELLRQMKSEIAAIHYSVDSLQSETRMHSEVSRNADEESV